jgi:hypothetical protein
MAYSIGRKRAAHPRPQGTALYGVKLAGSIGVGSFSVGGLGRHNNHPGVFREFHRRIEGTYQAVLHDTGDG